MLARPMRGPGLIVVLALVAGALVTLLVLGVFGDDITISPSDPSPTTPASSPTAPSRTPIAELNAALGEGLVASRLAPTLPPNPNLADTPTAWLRVIDHADEKPIADASLRTALVGHVVAFTDESGLAPIPLRGPEQLAAVIDGYLMRLVPARPGSTEAEPQIVRLVRDEWSTVRRVEFAASGTRIEEAFVRFRPHERVAPSTPALPRTDDVVKRAFDEHRQLASWPGCADVPVQLGFWSEHRVHRLVNGSDVRFLAQGEFLIEAATTNGFVGKVEVRIDAEPRTNASPLRVPMVPGAFLTGTVVDATGTPLADARLVQPGSDPLGLVATTGADGTFRFGPLPAGSITLHVHHGENQPLAFGPVTVPSEAVRIAMQPLSRSTLRGRVRAHPNQRPLAAATVAWTPPTGTPVTVKTNAEGLFVLPATGDADARLTIQALGHVERLEMVTPGSPFADYDLWPADPKERVAAGLTTIFSGSVLDAEGRPVADASVRWTPAQPTHAALGLANAGTAPGRRVLSGGTLDLPAAVRTGADGGFVLETNQFGPGRLHLFANDAIAQRLVAIAGITKNDIRLHP
jgi:hypothetical protein